jgi:membrane-bound lytic murein transglycosylase MltF
MGVKCGSTEARQKVDHELGDEFPQVKWYVEEDGKDQLMINLAAFEDSDAQYWPPSSEAQ